MPSLVFTDTERAEFQAMAANPQPAQQVTPMNAGRIPASSRIGQHQVNGRLTARLLIYVRHRPYLLCQCDCGRDELVRVFLSNFTSEKTKTCDHCNFTGDQISAAKEKKVSEEELQQRRANQNWDTEDGHGVVCLICGVTLARLGSIGKGKRNHLLDKHHMSPDQYRDFCEQQGWGRPETFSRHNQDNQDAWAKQNPRRIKESKRRTNKKRTPRSRLGSRQKQLTPEEKADRVQCLYCKAEGREVWLRELNEHHMLKFHPGKQHDVDFPGAPMIATTLREQRLDNIAARIELMQSAEQIVKEQRSISEAEQVSGKLANPEKYPWIPPDDVAKALGISPRTFYRKVKAGLYPRLVANSKGHYSAESVKAQKVARMK